MSEGIELSPMGSSAASEADSEYTPGALGRGFRAAEDAAKAAVHFDEGGLDAVSTWGIGAAGWYVLLLHHHDTLGL